MSEHNYRDETEMIHVTRRLNPESIYVNPPVARASTILHSSIKDMEEREAQKEQTGCRSKTAYGTEGTDTHKAFYAAMAEIEGGAAGVWAFSTGAAACTVPLLAFVKAGDHMLVVDSIYGVTRNFVETVIKKFGVEVEYFDPAEGADVEKRFKSNTTLLVMETPGSHSFEMIDVPAVAKVCQKHGVFSVIDNTWATPLYFKPLTVGVDVVVHAATKYICGHSDILMGVIACNERAWQKVWPVLDAAGQFSNADDCYMALRGLRTMKARVTYQAASARKVIDWLLTRPEVETVRYPALESDPSYPIWKRDFTGASSLFAVVFKPEYQEKINDMVDAITLFGRGYSWGGFESLMIRSYGRRAVAGSPFERMIRIAVGMEAPEDLIRDLEQAFEKFH